MLKNLKGNEEIKNSESEVYNSDGVPLKQEEAVDSMILGILEGNLLEAEQ